MKSRRFLQLVAGLTASAAIVAALLGFFCPPDVMPSMSKDWGTSSGMATLCPGNLTNSAVPGGNMGASGNCLNLHFGLMNHLTEYVGTKAVLGLTLILAAIIIYFVASKFLNAAKIEYVRFKHRYQLYSAVIRLSCQKKILAWLSLLESHGIAASV